MLNLSIGKIKAISKIQSLIYSIAFLSIMLFIGCEQKKSEEVSVPKDTVQVKIEEPAPVDTLVKDTTTLLKEPEVVFPDLKGKWTGTFDQRAVTLRITEQDGNSFKGAITINYREVINQQVSGTINEEKMEISMKDLLHSRYAGTYKGKISEDMKKLSGTFTQNVEKTKFSFSLKKQ
jgi:hypothetical protein